MTSCAHTREDLKKMMTEIKKNIFHFINFAGLEKRGITLNNIDRKVLFEMNENENLFITRTALRIALKEKINFTELLYNSTNQNLNYETFTHILLGAHKEIDDELGEML